MENKKAFKLRYIVIPLVIIVLIILGYMGMLPFPGAFRYQMIYSFEHFGKDCSELYTFQSPKETKVGLDIVRRARACMEYTGDEQSAPPTDALSKYYYFPYYSKPAEAEVTADLVKCVIHGNEGSVWFYYSLARRDYTGDLINGSWDVLTRCTIAKTESGEWTVTSVSEPP